MLSPGLLELFLELLILVAENLNRRLGLFPARSLDTELGLECSTVASILRIIASELFQAGFKGFRRSVR